MREEISKWFLKGIAASPGIVIGKAYVLQDVLLMVERRTIEEVRAEEEVSRLKQAIRRVVDELMKDSSQMALKIGKRDAEIFLAQIAILRDPYFVAQILKDIRENGANAESAVIRQVDEFGEAFKKMEDSYLRERGADLLDIGRRVVQKLLPPQQNPWDLKEPMILVSPELAPSDTVRLERGKVLAFATESGGKDSHAAILARSLGIPAVLGIDGLLSRVNKGDTVIVDGDTGIVLIRPPAELIRNYQDLQNKRESYQTELYELVSLPSQTLDGREIRLWANIGGLTDLEYSLRFGAYGIGLFRTELPFLVWGRFLSEEEQFSLYQKIVTGANGRDVTIRTLDFGGDKFFDDGKSQKEKNPFLGYRSIRVFLKEKDLFKRQLRAILRASAFGPVRILFPMISSIEELRHVRDLFEKTKGELRDQGNPFDEKIPFGS